MTERKAAAELTVRRESLEYDFAEAKPLRKSSGGSSFGAESGWFAKRCFGSKASSRPTLHTRRAQNFPDDCRLVAGTEIRPAETEAGKTVRGLAEGETLLKLTPATVLLNGQAVENVRVKY